MISMTCLSCEQTNKSCENTFKRWSKMKSKSKSGLEYHKVSFWTKTVEFTPRVWSVPEAVNSSGFLGSIRQPNLSPAVKNFIAVVLRIFGKHVDFETTGTKTVK